MTVLPILKLVFVLKSCKIALKLEFYSSAVLVLLRKLNIFSMLTLHGVISVKEFKATAEKISLKNTQLRGYFAIVASWSHF